MASLTGRIILAAARRNATYTPVRFCKSKFGAVIIRIFLSILVLISSSCITFCISEKPSKIDISLIKSVKIRFFVSDRREQWFLDAQKLIQVRDKVKNSKRKNFPITFFALNVSSLDLCVY
jgi:hypothetical protein